MCCFLFVFDFLSHCVCSQALITRAKMKALHVTMFVCVYLNVSVTVSMCARVSPCSCMAALQDKEPIESLHESPITGNSSYFQTSLALIMGAHCKQNMADIYTLCSATVLSCTCSSALIGCVNERVKDHGKWH